MHGVLLSVAALACPLGMGLMMWFMAKGMRGDTGSPREVSPLDDIDALRSEHRRLGEQIDELERAGAPTRRRVDRVRSWIMDEVWRLGEVNVRTVLEALNARL